MQVFKKYSQIALNSGVNILRDYKQDLIHKDRVFLLKLCYQIIAYDSGILMQAWEDYPRKNLQTKSIVNYIAEDAEYFGEENIKKARDRVSNQFRSSFDNKYSEKIKTLNLTAELMRITPQAEEASTLREDFQKNWLPEYNYLKEKNAKSLQVKFKPNNKKLSSLQLLAFDEIISLVYRKKQVNKNLIQFLEQAIDVYFPMFLKDLGISSKTNLVLLRKNSGHKFNTVCHRCGLRLLKKNNKRYCTRRENRSCYNARLKEGKDSGFSGAILRAKNKCENCSKHSSLDFIYNHRSCEMQFCSNRCWETYRKRDYRKAKATSSRIPIP